MVAVNEQKKSSGNVFKIYLLISFCLSVDSLAFKSTCNEFSLPFVALKQRVAEGKKYRYTLN